MLVHINGLAILLSLIKYGTQISNVFSNLHLDFLNLTIFVSVSYIIHTLRSTVLTWLKS